MSEPAINHVYDRTDPRGDFPSLPGPGVLEHNRLAVFWRPLLDLHPSPYAPMRLQALSYVNSWLADPESTDWAWFSRHSVAGLRNQVVRHTGLAQYACKDPRDLPEDLRTSQWQVLAEALDNFADLPPLRRRMVVFHLVQLSFYNVAVALTAADQPDGTAETDLYLYEVARAHTGSPAYGARAADLFEYLATTSADPTLALAAAGQGVSHAIRRDRDLDIARKFESYAATADGEVGWLHALARSRFHRAVALLRLRERDFRGMSAEIKLSVEFGEQLLAAEPTGADRYVAVENQRIILESQIKAAGRAPIDVRAEQVRLRCDQLLAIDPYCIQARLVVADGYSAAGMFAEAAHWYERAGELGTGAGAMAWYRAGQCHDLLGRPADAANAMGRCLELDTTAVQPREYLERLERG
ncbi:hypothetical protein HPO96_22455 [Kribbella sandramycini]|uniref:Tetratricopeptide (TPR) repeat protein n=1 Tax=Kribbella sandramycini TaxID=60450 RepID=A0A7Y4L279_9ACTN|nr:hypothetical protein [Kribbella sandramycini]MBB6566324.1 tetratricopeptide (TPR) repeat protein [Kribbella sandramycini]NOL43014.1 hypothetical protein [Kribbella sandramycini]